MFIPTILQSILSQTFQLADSGSSMFEVKCRRDFSGGDVEIMRLWCDSFIGMFISLFSCQLNLNREA